MMESFKEIVDLIGECPEVWVELTSGMRVCLVAVTDYTHEVFVGKYVPCVQQSRSFPIPYSKIKCVRGGV